MKKFLENIKARFTKILANKKVKITGFIFVSVIFVFTLVFFVYVLSFNNKIYPNVKIGSTNIGGLSKIDAKKILSDKLNSIKDKQIEFYFQDKKIDILPNDLNINYDIDSTILEAYSVGRKGSIINKIKEELSAIFTDKKLKIDFSLDHSKEVALYENISKEIDIESKDSTLILNGSSVEATESNSGRSVNTYNLQNNFMNEIGFLFDKKIEIPVDNLAPKITKDKLTSIKENVSALISNSLVLTYENQSFEWDKNVIFGFIDITASSIKEKSAKSLFGKIYAKENVFFQPSMAINPEKIKIEIEKISGHVNKEPVDARLSMNNGKVDIFTSSQDGYALDKDRTLSLVLSEINKRSASIGSKNNLTLNAIKLPVQVKKPSIESNTINNLGINELIGTGTTNYKGSPSNRITNIKVGSSIFNGVLIKPGEEFSTIKTLGEISLEKGFLPELVIKEDGTKPEVGGGLCQVSTTLFRAILNAGLPVTERTNHKYRVSYYEPPVGMDATIYDPSPDLKFINDTPGYILIQTSIKGTEITFELYGTKDNRVVEMSDPIMYDVTSPDAPLYKEDPSIAPGEVKQKEKAHNGAKASFHYKVTKDGKVTFEKTFISTYVPWRAVYLVAPGELPGSNPTPSPSPTT